jgi:hypothetical protein
MGVGRWGMEWGLLPSLGLYSPEGASPIFKLPYPMLSSKEQKRERSVCLYISRGRKLKAGTTKIR